MRPPYGLDPAEPGAAQFLTLSFSLTLGGVTYGVLASAADPANGQGVVLFDLSGPGANSPSYQGTPHYGVGFFSLGNGNTGIIGDWTAATAPVTVAQPGPAVFNNFYGVGYNPGTFALTAPNGTAAALVLNEGVGSPADYNSGDPGLVFTGGNAGQPVIADNAAQILQVSEPAAVLLLGTGLLALAGLRRRSVAQRAALAFRRGPSDSAAARRRSRSWQKVSRSPTAKPRSPRRQRTLPRAPPPPTLRHPGRSQARSKPFPAPLSLRERVGVRDSAETGLHAGAPVLPCTRRHRTGTSQQCMA